MKQGFNKALWEYLFYASWTSLMAQISGFVDYLEFADYLYYSSIDDFQVESMKIGLTYAYSNFKTFFSLRENVARIYFSRKVLSTKYKSNVSFFRVFSRFVFLEKKWRKNQIKFTLGNQKFQ